MAVYLGLVDGVEVLLGDVGVFARAQQAGVAGGHDGQVLALVLLRLDHLWSSYTQSVNTERRNIKWLFVTQREKITDTA